MVSFFRRFVPKSILNFYHYFLAKFSAFVYHNPSEEMIIIGVTGTNGKTTTVNLIGSVLESAGYMVGWASTVNFKVGGRIWLNDTKMTMLGRFKLQKLLREMADIGCHYAIVETSSEGIKQYRHSGINYDICIFTNLTPEHIESHGNFEKYKEAKGKLFSHLSNSSRKKISQLKNFKNQPALNLPARFQNIADRIDKIAIVNLDSEHSQYFLKFNVDEKWGYSLGYKPFLIGPGVLNRKIVVDEIEYFSDHTFFKINNNKIKINLLGEYNIYNSLAALVVGLSQNIKLEVIKEALAKVSPVPGRLEFINRGQDFSVIVDYAPEPESLRQTYEVLKRLAPKRIIHVLGSCGGGRDIARRPILGAMAAQNVDFVIVTNEDPYDDDPKEIINQVADGALQTGKVVEDVNLFKILDRYKAIERAISLAKTGDLVLLTGKGAEQAIVVQNRKKIPWDERRVCEEVLDKLLGKL